MASDPIQFPAPAPVEEAGIRALPANLEAEAAFIGAALIDNRVIEEHAGNLRPVDRKSTRLNSSHRP